MAGTGDFKALCLRPRRMQRTRGAGGCDQVALALHDDAGDGVQARRVREQLAFVKKPGRARVVHADARPGHGVGVVDDGARRMRKQAFGVHQVVLPGPPRVRCGQSRAQVLLHANTTPHLLADMEALRAHLGIQRWLLFGGSWGATLALAYAQAHPQHVSGLVLRGVFTATRAETCWLYGARGAAARHPQAWQRLCAAAGADVKAGVLDAMNHRLQANDQDALTAAHAWWAWEHDLMDAESLLAHAPRATVNDTHALALARIGVHYARNAWFLDEGQLLANAARLHGIHGVIVQGQRDLITPASAARALHVAWPQAHLIEVASAGHASSHPGMARHLIHATETMAATAEETPHVRAQTA